VQCRVVSRRVESNSKEVGEGIGEGSRGDTRPSVSDIRWLVVESSVGVTMSKGCNCGQVCLWTFKDEVYVVSRRVEGCRIVSRRVESWS